jgi:hypothetical protein
MMSGILLSSVLPVSGGSMRVHRNLKLALVAGLALGAVGLPALADNEPVIVVPGRAGVPVMMYGVDVSGAVIEGEWGLNRPGVVAPTVIMPYWAPYPEEGAAAPYYPRTGRKPPYGRLEILPQHRRGSVAQPFFREWHSESQPTPATMEAPLGPPVIVGPRLARPRHAPTRPLPHPAPPHTP